MPSRKRAKGRERKLKQKAREPLEQSASQAPLNGGNINIPEPEQNVKCDHGGFKHKTVQGHPVTHFMETFIETVTSEICNVSVQDSMKMTFEKHEEVWKDDAMRKMAIDTMLSIGTNLILHKGIEGASCKSEAIIYLEKYTSGDTFDSVLSKASEDVGYLLHSGDRDVVHFYKKRIPCSCLDGMYSEIKKCQVRGGICFYCNQIIKRKDLKTCSRCKFAQYCSKECQKLAWPSHKENCMAVANIHERVNKVRTARSNEGIF